MDYHSFIIGYLDSVWSAESPEVAAAYFSPDAQIGGLVGTDPLTPQDMVTLIAAVLNWIEAPRWTVDRVVAQDDRVAYLLTGTAQCKRTGEPVALTGQVMLRIDGGMIVEAFNHFDMIGFFTQLGLIPPDMLEAALSDTLAA